MKRNPLPNSSDGLPAPHRIGRDTYIFRRRIGSHGQRFRAYTKGRSDKSFLVHVLPRDKSSEDQIAVLRGLTRSDPTLPQIEDSSVEGNLIYMVLPWVPGRPLREFIDEGQRNPNSPHRMTAVEAVKLFNGFVHLLRRFNHKCNMIHGDLKPENLTVAREPNRLLMIDFGSSWVVERTVRRQTTDGTDFQYAAPELQQPPADGGAGRLPYGDFRSDQFSASVIFYEMLTFERPFEGAGALAATPQFRDSYGQTLVPPSQKSPDRHLLGSRVWKAIDHTVMTGLNFDPARRFQNFDSWLNALKAIRVESDRAEELSKVSKAAVWLADIVHRVRRPRP